MTRLLIAVFSIVAVFSLASCTNISGASKSSTSLTSFLGFSELPDWYIRSKYTYPDSKWIDNDFQTAIHYRDVGEGPVVVLLHGEINSLHTWEKWIETLSQDYRVIAVDLPGSGLTSAPHCIDDPEDTCPENLTEDYIRHTFEFFIEDLKLRKFSLVGSSYGGYLAANYALDHPEKLDKLILISPMGFQQELPWILNYVTTAGMDFVSRYFQPTTIITTIVDDFYGETDNLKRSNLNRYIHLAQSEGAHAANVYQLQLVRKLMEQGMLLDLSKIQTPTLLLWGEYDSWGNFEHAARWQEELGNSTLVNYPFSGHVLMEESPETSVADTIAFISDEPLPSIEGLGTGGSFTINQAVEGLDQEALFGPSDSGSKETPASNTQNTDDETTLMEDAP